MVVLFLVFPRSLVIISFFNLLVGLYMLHIHAPLVSRQERRHHLLLPLQRASGLVRQAPILWVLSKRIGGSRPAPEDRGPPEIFVPLVY